MCGTSSNPERESCTRADMSPGSHFSGMYTFNKGIVVAKTSPQYGVTHTNIERNHMMGQTIMQLHYVL